MRFCCWMCRYVRNTFQPACIVLHHSLRNPGAFLRFCLRQFMLKALNPFRLKICHLPHLLISRDVLLKLNFIITSGMLHHFRTCALNVQDLVGCRMNSALNVELKFSHNPCKALIALQNLVKPRCHTTRYGRGKCFQSIEALKCLCSVCFLRLTHLFH